MFSAATTRRDIHWERRCGGERRNGSFPCFKYWGRRGRRREIRRYGEQEGAYLDWYPPRLMWLTVAILCLCSMDAAFTLALLQQGALELNPFMAMLTGFNTSLFVGVKMGITGLALVCLAVHQNFVLRHIVQVRQLIYGFMLLYVGVVAYESLLLLIDPSSGR